jgi:hypothetical protein
MIDSLRRMAASVVTLVAFDIVRLRLFPTLPGFFSRQIREIG